MADLGTLDVRVLPLTGNLTASAHQQYGHATFKVLSLSATLSVGRAGDMSADFSGVLAGTVLDGATPVPDCDVALFCRRSMKIIYLTKTNASGTFSVPNVAKNTPSSTYFAVAFPPNGANYNALIFDQITPV